MGKTTNLTEKPWDMAGLSRKFRIANAHIFIVRYIPTKFELDERAV